MSTLDRMFFWSYVRSYFIVLVCLMCMYVIADLFTNLNDFVKDKGGFASVARHMIGYYSVQIWVILDRFYEAIPLLAAVFAVAWMQRNNELLPQLSAGVSTHRAVRPILFGAALTVGLGPVNSEIIIPSLADRLTIPRDDPELQKPTQVRSGFDPATKEHITGESAFRLELKVTRFEYTSSSEGGGGLFHLLAQEAIYIPADQPKDGLSGGWILYKTTPEKLTGTLPDNLQQLLPGRYFLKTKDLDFDAVTRRPTWYVFAPTHELWNLLDRPETGRQHSVAVLFHSRITRPALGFILVVLGLAVVLKDQNRHVFISTGLCLVMGTVFYLVWYGSRFMGELEYLPPTLAAWLPVILFGPFAVSMFDGVHT